MAKKIVQSVSSEETTSQQLFSHLFEACNILRGPINQDEYKSYVTPILFFKRISDVYDEETQIALDESGGDEEYAAFPENHSFDIPQGCHWNDVREAHENIGVAIVKAMTGIERANPDTLSGVFSSFDDANWTDKGKLSDERLKDLVEHMSKITGDYVYDGACGTGGMLLEAIRYIGNDQLTYGKIFGQEKNLATSAIARMNLFLHGAKDVQIVQGDTLRSPAFLEAGQLRTFDCVIANPPFSLKNWGADQFSSDIYGRNMWGSPTDSNADFAWLQHMICSMDKKKGRCAIVLPQGVLFRSGKEGNIRKQLVDSDKLECIITLVGGVFYSTGVSACILVMNNNKPSNHIGRVCMIDASNIYTPQRAQNIMTEEDIQKVFTLYTNYEDVIEQVKIVTLDDIRQKDYTLAINNYIEKKEAETVPPEKVRRQYFAALQEVKDAEEAMKRLLVEGGYISE